MNLLENDFFDETNEFRPEIKPDIHSEDLKIEIKRLIKETKIEDLPNLVFELITDPPPWKPWN